MCYYFDGYFWTPILLLFVLLVLLLYVTIALIDGYNDNNDDDVVDNDMKMQLMMMILKNSDEMKQFQSAKIVAKYFQNLGDSLLLPSELIKVQAVLAEKFTSQRNLMHINATAECLKNQTAFKTSQQHLLTYVSKWRISRYILLANTTEQTGLGR